MQTNSTIVSVFILFPALQGRVIHCADGETLATKIFSLAFTVGCLILFSIRNFLNTIDPLAMWLGISFRIKPDYIKNEKQD